MARKKTLIKYGISLGIDTTDMARGAREAKAVNRRLNRDIQAGQKANREYKHSFLQLREAWKTGKITLSEYKAGLVKYTQRRDRANGSLARANKLERIQAQRVRKSAAEERLRNRELAKRNALEKQAMAQKARMRQQYGAMGAGGLSALGMGGPMAGGARFMGNYDPAMMGGMGMGSGLALLGGGLGLMGMGKFINKSIDQFAALEGKLIDLKVLFGESEGESLGKQFKELAKNTALTTSQLVSNAKTWASYGLTADGIVDRMRMLGEVTGGNTEKFHNLTVAFAQVNAQGKLMGQEKNQLINAGFSLAEVAKVAGVEMKDFLKAMENGAISADHLNQALVNMTSEGGLYFGLLEEKAKSLEGLTSIANSQWEEYGQTVGESWKPYKEAYLKTKIWLGKSLMAHEQYFQSLREGNPTFTNFGGQSGGGWAGSYSTTGNVLQGGMGSVTSMKSDEMGLAYSFLAMLMRMEEGNYFGRSASLDEQRRKDVTFGTGMTDTLLNGADISAYPEEVRNRDKKAKEMEERRERIKREEEAWNARRKTQIENYSKKRYSMSFRDGSGGGYNAMSQQKEQYDLKLMYKKGELGYDEFIKLMKMSNAYFKMMKDVDTRKEREKDTEERRREAERQKQFMDQFMMYDKYENQGLSAKAQAFLTARDKQVEAIGQGRQGGGTGGLAGGGSEYALMRNRQKQVMDKAAEMAIQKSQEQQLKEIKMNSRKMITEMRKNGEFMAKSGGAV